MTDQPPKPGVPRPGCKADVTQHPTAMAWLNDRWNLAAKQRQVEKKRQMCLNNTRGSYLVPEEGTQTNPHSFHTLGLSPAYFKAPLAPPWCRVCLNQQKAHLHFSLLSPLLFQLIPAKAP